MLALMTPYVEPDCTITHRGRAYEAGGAVVTDDTLVAYPKFDREVVGALGTLCNWHGIPIGTCRIAAKWPTPRSWFSSHAYQIEAHVGGRIYTGRGAGSDMIYRGRLTARSRRLLSTPSA